MTNLGKFLRIYKMLDLLITELYFKNRCSKRLFTYQSAQYLRQRTVSAEFTYKP